MVETNNELSKITNRRSILLFTIPSIIMVLFTSTYSLIDGLFISNYVSTDGLAAVNIVTPFYSVLTAIGFMMASGGVAILGKKMGEGNEKGARSDMTLITIVILVVSVIFMLAGILFTEEIVTLLGADETLLGYSTQYLWYLSIFTPILMMQFLMMQFLITAGRPVLSMALVFAGGFTNIILDYVFVAQLDMGVIGAAVATGIGALIPSIGGLLFFLRNRKGSLFFTKPSRDVRMLGHCCFNGMSELINDLSMAITMLLFNLSMMYYVGPDGVSAITIISYSQFVAVSLVLGYSMGISSAMAFNYGEQNRKNMKTIFKESMIIVGAISIMVFLVMEIFGKYFVGAFADSGTEVYQLAVNGLFLYSISFLLCGVNIYASSLFTSLSNGALSASIAATRELLLAAPLILLLPLIFDINGIWLAVPIAEVLTLILSLYLIKSRGKRYGYIGTD